MFSIDEIMGHTADLFDEEGFIGIGSTRKVYRRGDVVIKKHLHQLGYRQSVNEQGIYRILEEAGLAAFIAPVVFVNEDFAVQPYYEALPLKEGATYDLDWETDERMSAELRQALIRLDSELGGFDWKDSGNYGLNSNGKLVLIDYGMTKELYENEWVPLAEAGILPQIYFECCEECGEEKELRIYGEDDRDRRCVACGKE